MSGSKADIDLTSRKTTLNEWQYNRTIEIVFILQLMFIGLSIVCIAAVFAKRGLFKFAFVWYLAAVLGALLLVVWILRTVYTKNVRDRFHWFRRMFSGDGSTKPALAPETVAAATAATTAVCRAAAAGNTATVCGP